MYIYIYIYIYREREREREIKGMLIEGFWKVWVPRGSSIRSKPAPNHKRRYPKEMVGYDLLGGELYLYFLLL